MTTTTIMWVWIGFSAVCLIGLALALYWRNR